jgi:kinesin family protein 2/24
MCTKHESLIKIILNEEDELINNHREQLDVDVDLAKQEMALLEEVDKPQSDIGQYVKKLDEILLKKMEMIGNMRHKLVKF